MNDDIVFTYWVKSSLSFSNGNCTEVAARRGVVGVRDSKNRDGGMLTFGRAGWESFIASVKAAE